MTILLHLFAFSTGPCQDAPLPPLNERIVAYVRAWEGRKVGRGECWDLAAGALNAAGARWDGLYAFGRTVDIREESILPGDIVQFEHVLIEHRTATSASSESFMKHTAVVIDLIGPGELLVAHQNFGRAGRKVSLYKLVPAHVVKGELLFHRPEP